MLNMILCFFSWWPDIVFIVLNVSFLASRTVNSVLNLQDSSYAHLHTYTISLFFDFGFQSHTVNLSHKQQQLLWVICNRITQTSSNAILCALTSALSVLHGRMALLCYPNTQGQLEIVPQKHLPATMRVLTVPFSSQLFILLQLRYRDPPKCLIHLLFP